MPKMKTRSAVKKRYRTTASGKLKRKKAGTRHILTSKTRKRKRDLRRTAIVGNTHEKQIKLMVGNR
jgi:large subunit ribosomal protein L35